MVGKPCPSTIVECAHERTHGVLDFAISVTVFSVCYSALVNRMPNSLSTTVSILKDEGGGLRRQGL